MRMVRIRHMRVGVLRGFMAMRVAVRACRQHVVGVQMVAVGSGRVVAVGVFVLQNRMRVWMTMRFKQVQNDARQHQQTSDEHDPAHRSVTQGERPQCPNKRRKSKHGARTCSPKSTLCQKIKPQTQAITHSANSQERQSRVQRRYWLAKPCRQHG